MIRVWLRTQVPLMAALRHNDAWHLAAALTAAAAAHPQLTSVAADSGDSSIMAGRLSLHLPSGTSTACFVRQ